MKQFNNFLSYLKTLYKNSGNLSSISYDITYCLLTESTKTYISTYFEIFFSHKENTIIVKQKGMTVLFLTEDTVCPPSFILGMVDKHSPFLPIHKVRFTSQNILPWPPLFSMSFFHLFNHFCGLWTSLFPLSATCLVLENLWSTGNQQRVPATETACFAT